MHRSASPLLVLLAFASVAACAESPSPTASSTAQAPDVAAAPAPAADAAPSPPMMATVPATAPAPAALPDAQARVAVAAAPAVAASSPLPGTRAATPAALPLAVVHKTPTCGCCGLWVDHLRAAGFEVEVKEHDDLQPVKARLGVPADKASCHTAEIGGFFVEGHVPAEDIKRLLAQKPRARGLAVPGMPLGSPGMEMPDGRVQPYTVELVQADGSTVAYATHGQ